MTRTTPLVSVCVPTYNYGRFLSDCIESVLAQTISDWELIIADDCSSDITSEVVQRYADDSRIRYVVNEHRLGMNGNLKRAADLGAGKYLKILCADDWLAPRCLEIMCGFVEAHRNVVIVTAAEIHTDEKGSPRHQQFLFGTPLSLISGEVMLDRMAKGEGFGGNSSLLIRASAYHEVGGYDPLLLYAGDYDLAARLCRIGDYLHCDEPLFYGRGHPHSSSSVDPSRHFDAIDAFIVPAKIFYPRSLFSRNWLRYQRLTASLTARYIVTTAVAYVRRNRTYATGLARVLSQYGNPLGIVVLPFHAVLRLYRRLGGWKSSITAPPAQWMRLPVRTRRPPSNNG